MSDKVIMLHHTDAAGVLYFAHQLTLVHEVYEVWLDSIGWPLRRFFDREKVLVLIVHAEADYKAPLKVGDRVKIELAVSGLKDNSFVLEYRIIASDGCLSGSVQTVHVAVDKSTMQKTALPAELRKTLQAHLAPA